MKRRRVALVSSSYHPHLGGVEEHVRQLARLLRERGHRVEVWTVDRGEHLGVRDVDGVRVRYLPTPLPARSTAGITGFVRRLPGAVTAWGQAFRALRPEVLHVQCFGPNGVYAFVLSRLMRTPLVVSSHGETFADDHAVFDRSALLAAALRGAVRRARLTTGCSEVVLDDLRRRFGLRDGVVVPNGVDTGAVPLPRKPEEPPLLLALGRLERTKGFDLLVSAFATADLPVGTRLVVAGEGSAHASLVRQAEALGVTDRVRLPGRLSRDEVADHLARASVVVVPSRREAFGMVVLEAWQAGVPVVVTDRDGPADLVTDGVDGLVVDPEDPAALGAAIRRVLIEDGLADRLVDAGSAAVAGYTWDRVAAKFEDAYDRCGT